MKVLSPSSLFLLSALTLRAAPPPADIAPERTFPMLPPDQAAATIQLPEGYRLELVLSEPQIKEPMAIAFDGDGRMYVVEMRTYMQDINGTGEHEPTSRISRHESSKGDGVYDRHTTYLDNLLLPRMVLPLDDRVLVGVTDTNDITQHRDTNGDGVADEKSVFYAGGPRGGNMEHQPSGLLWAMDNWIYTTYNAYRLRWTPSGTALKEPTAPNGGQWGLAQDNDGKPWFSNAGGEKGVWNFQTPIVYAAVNVKDQWPDDWMTVWPLVGLADVQGGGGRFRKEDRTLNHFTASCGQEIFRGDRLPPELVGDVFLPEPVGRLIRRGKVEVKDGVTTLTNPYPQSEFIRSTDPNFRPVNMATGPDGCLYIVDAYRGIIQEGNWTRPGSYLRTEILRNGLDKNIGHGRVWRLVHKDHKPSAFPRMFSEKPAQWVAHLAHPNGMWRDNAQRLLIVTQDKSVVPALESMARIHANPLARLHALWTLEGLDALTPALALEKLKDAAPRVRAGALRAAESLLETPIPELVQAMQSLTADPDPQVALQVLMTGKRLGWKDWTETANAVITASTSRGVQEIGRAVISGGGSQVVDNQFSKQDLVFLKKGEAIYKELCFACHGADGKGMAVAGGAKGANLGPPLAGSRTVTGAPDGALLVLLHGLSGPVNGKTYEAQMVSMATNADEWIAAVASFVRNAFGNQGSLVSAADVARLRKAHAARAAPWTEAELAAILPRPLDNRGEWKLTASHKSGGCSAAIDGKTDTRWDTGVSQMPGQWFQIELPRPVRVGGLRLDAAGSSRDYPRGYQVEVSTDGKTWAKVLEKGKGTGSLTDMYFEPTLARYVRVTQTGSVNGLFWSIHELAVLGIP